MLEGFGLNTSKSLSLLETGENSFAAAYFDADRPCTLVIDEIEAIWRAVADRDD